jgi:hypothetical protein
MTVSAIAEGYNSVRSGVMSQAISFSGWSQLQKRNNRPF